MKTTASIAAVVGLAAAQASYGNKCPAVGTSGSDGRYSCNPAHAYPEGQICELQDGCYYLRIPGPGVSTSVTVDVPASRTVSIPSYGTASVSVDIPVSRTSVHYTTEVRTAFTTYCPEPTTITFGERTTTIHKATTVTLLCPGGCTVTKPVTVSVDIPETRTATVKVDIPETRTATASVDVPVYKTPVVSSPVASVTKPVIVSVDIPESRTASPSVDVPVYRTPSASVDVPVYRTHAPSAPTHAGNGTGPAGPSKTSPVIYTGAATKIASGAAAALGLLAALFL